jgi:hypothetical protein
MTETYTFSRALHLMRYGGKKMRNCNWRNTFCIFVQNDVLKYYDTLNRNVHYGVELDADDIMGNWIEVKDA